MMLSSRGGQLEQDTKPRARLDGLLHSRRGEDVVTIAPGALTPVTAEPRGGHASTSPSSLLQTLKNPSLHDVQTAARPRGRRRVWRCCAATSSIPPSRAPLRRAVGSRGAAER